MTGVKLTPEWLGAVAEGWQREAIACRRAPSVLSDEERERQAQSMERKAEAYRLAARALRAKEWAESISSPAAHDTYGCGMYGAAKRILAILNGETQ